ncbi:MAG TPA: hypothetical protein VKS22_01915 [Candidatus Binataceae bacterium]|nr:hypothetical protein [Candidatus Binataceae bacterium]
MSSRRLTEGRLPLQLGLFMPNCSYTASISTRKRVLDDWTYDLGIEGALMCLEDYYGDLERFDREIAPRLRDLKVID